MRTRLLALGLMIGMGMGSAVRDLECAPAIRFEIGAFIPDAPDNGSFAPAKITTPAVFPKPASSTEVGVPYTMTCPKFKAESGKDFLTINGDVQTMWGHLLASQSDGDPDTHGPTLGKVLLLSFEGFRYKSIRQDWYQNNVYADFVNGRLTVHTEGYPEVAFKQGVIGARVNGGKLQPIWFNQHLVGQVKYRPGDVVELYVTSNDTVFVQEFKYMLLDFKKGLLSVRNDVPFPSK
ncbi:hypothetical protein Q0M94_28425 (plasmid) [Deinococcus radiomollis]|uniref:hypothetical protein n=1 Tax=Deinococcus radiomollis TaxID=468916 RepID=UPI003892B13B